MAMRRSLSPIFTSAWSLLRNRLITRHIMSVVFPANVVETGRLIAERLRHSKHILRDSLLKHEEGQEIGWDEARSLVMGGNSKYGEYKESAHTLLANSITQPNLEASLGKEFGNLREPSLVST
jgi:hypothetical protein